MDRELKAKDWDVMILHYLGLDHVGHSLGPQSSRMAPKQGEMDEIIQKIYTAIDARHKELGESWLFVVCSDHGMNDVL